MSALAPLAARMLRVPWLSPLPPDPDAEDDPWEAEDTEGPDGTVNVNANGNGNGNGNGVRSSTFFGFDLSGLGGLLPGAAAPGDAAAGASNGNGKGKGAGTQGVFCKNERFVEVRLAFPHRPCSALRAPSRPANTQRGTSGVL